MPSYAKSRRRFLLAVAIVTVALISSAAASTTQAHQCLAPVDQSPFLEWQTSPTTLLDSTGSLMVEPTPDKPFTFSSLFQSLVSIFLLCGECVILGATLFGGMVHFTPGVGLHASKSSSLASLMAVLSAVGYHAVALGWYLDHLGVLHVLCFAPVFQALLTVAIALLYTAVMELYNRADDNRSSSHSFSPSDSISQRHSHRRARWY